MKKNYKVSCDEIKIRVDIHWPEADVDAVFSEMSRMFPTSHTVSNSKTPKSDSVDNMLEQLWEEFKSDPYNKNTTQWQKRGIEIGEYTGLMMGNAHVMFTIDLTKTPIESLQDVIMELKSVVSKHTSKGVKYYKQETKLSSGIGMNI